MATSLLPKRADEQVPFCRDQGLPYLAGAGHSGLSVQAAQWPMSASGIVLFADLGWSPMQSGDYRVFIANHTSAERTGVVALVDRKTTQITIAGPTLADVLDVVIVGQVQGQLA